MKDITASPEHMEFLCDLARQAGAAIMDVHRRGFHVKEKADHSPLTEADLASQAVIAPALAERYPDIPVLSEEGAGADYGVRKGWERFWLVDPLDGTKEFVKENGEFCVCIALVEGRYPVAGVIYAPTRDALYHASRDLGAFRSLKGGPAEPLRTRKADPELGRVVVASRSHPDPRLEELLAKTRVRERITAGSAIKFCLVAEGTADYYPRLNPTMEWDTAAGQALVEAAGGTFTTLEGERFFYNKESLRNKGFVAQA